MGRDGSGRWVWLRAAGTALCAASVCAGAGNASAQAIIVDHNHTALGAIPETWIGEAKDTLHIAYGHTSHGSQVTTGMTGLYGWKGDLYRWADGPTAGALHLNDYFVSGDLGAPDRETWAQRTRAFLDAERAQQPPPAFLTNVVMWSWCGQADTTEANIQVYLDLMTALIADYPDVTFVYMTGHLNGTGAAGNLNQRNNQIRAHVQATGGALYDFADIESYDPDGLVSYMELLANDNCDYDSDGNGTRDTNWAVNWQNSHVEGVDWYSCSAAHSQALNGNLKAYAAWWLWARLAGWPGPQAERQLSIEGASVGEGDSPGESVLTFNVSLVEP